MVRKTAILSILVIFLVALSGCATSRKQKDLEIQGLRNQITVLETQLQTKEDEISSLKESLARQEQEKEAPVVKQVSKNKIIGEAKSRPNVKQVQIALKNAGFDPGLLDGKMGKRTTDAIKAFQRAQNLPVDGKVGRETWSLLKEYLYKKTK